MFLSPSHHAGTVLLVVANQRLFGTTNFATILYESHAITEFDHVSNGPSDFQVFLIVINYTQT